MRCNMASQCGSGVHLTYEALYFVTYTGLERSVTLGGLRSFEFANDHCCFDAGYFQTVSQRGKREWTSLCGAVRQG
jgi:hypothetical protein